MDEQIVEINNRLLHLHIVTTYKLVFFLCMIWHKVMSVLFLYRKDNKQIERFVQNKEEGR